MRRVKLGEILFPRERCQKRRSKEFANRTKFADTRPARAPTIFPIHFHAILAMAPRRKPPSSGSSLRETLYFCHQEQRRAGRYVAGGTALAVTLLGLHHLLLRGTSTIAGVCIPAIIMACYIIWVLYSAHRDRRKVTIDFTTRMLPPFPPRRNRDVANGNYVAPVSINDRRCEKSMARLTEGEGEGGGKGDSDHRVFRISPRHRFLRTPCPVPDGIPGEIK